MLKKLLGIERVKEAAMRVMMSESKIENESESKDEGERESESESKVKGKILPTVTGLLKKWKIKCEPFTIEIQLQMEPSFSSKSIIREFGIIIPQKRQNKTPHRTTPMPLRVFWEQKVQHQEEVSSPRRR